MSVLRLARGITGRDKIIKFAGCYHGHVDALLAAAGSGVATLAIARLQSRRRHSRHPGVTEATTADTIVLPYNDRAGGARGVRRLRRRDRGGDHRGRRRATWASSRPASRTASASTRSWPTSATAHGALFISDEVMTGFRVSRSGQYGLDGVEPDLMTFGKVMGGGFPAAAFGGRADLMQHLAPVGGVYQAGTLSGQPGRHRGRTDHAAAGHRRRLRPRRPGLRPAAGRGRPRPCGGRRAARDPARREPVQRVLRRRGRDRRARTTPRPPTPVHRRATRRSSTPCSTPASTCRRARSRVGFCPPPTMMEPWTGSSTALPGRPPTRGGAGEADRTTEPQ